MSPEDKDRQRAEALFQRIREARLSPGEPRSLTARREGLALCASDLPDYKVSFLSALLGVEIDAATGIMPPPRMNHPDKWLTAMRAEASARVERGPANDEWALNITALAEAAGVDRGAARAWRESDEFRKAVNQYAAHLLRRESDPCQTHAPDSHVVSLRRKKAG